MKESKLITYLKSFRHLDIDQGWFFAQKKNLQKFIKENPLPSKASSFHIFPVFGRNFRFVTVALAAVLILGLSLGTVRASKDSLPGDALFPIKLFTEEVEKFLARDDFQKAEVSIKITNRRLEEVIKLSSSGSAIEENQEHIKKSLERFKQELKTAEGWLVKLDIKKKGDKETLKLALEFGENLANHEEILEQIEDIVPEEVKEAILAAKKVSVEGGDVSFKIALKLKIETEASGEEGEGEEEAEEESLGEEIKSKITEKMKERAQDQIADAEEALSEAEGEAEALTEISRAAQVLLERAEQRLANAKEAFDEEKYGRAFGQAMAAEKLAENAQRIMDRFGGIEEEDEEDEDEDEDEDEELPPLDTTAPAISQLSARNTTSTSTRIKWKTNEPADSKVWYGTSSPLVIPNSTPMVSSSDLVFNHELEISSLTPNTTYYYKAVSTDAAGNTASSAEQTFTTLE